MCIWNVAMKSFTLKQKESVSDKFKKLQTRVYIHHNIVAFGWPILSQCNCFIVDVLILQTLMI